MSVSGSGDARSAMRSARDVADALAEAVPGAAIVDGALHVESLRLTLPAGAGRAEILRALREALAGQTRGHRR
ncbi:hypothetical protein AB4144_03725 [Rhizobiaceae sp. 2RAB30]